MPSQPAPNNGKLALERTLFLYRLRHDNRFIRFFFARKGIPLLALYIDYAPRSARHHNAKQNEGLHYSMAIEQI